MAQVVGPIASPNAYEVFKIGNYQLPGAVHVLPVEKKYQYEWKKASGDDGGTLVIKGMDQTAIDVELEFFTDSQLEEWQTMRPLIFNEETPSLRDRKLLSHPVCSNAKIDSGIVVSVTDTEPIAGSNYKIKLKIIAFHKMKATTHTPKPANTTIIKDNAFSNAGKPKDPRDAAGRPSQKGQINILGGTGKIKIPKGALSGG